MGTPTDALQQDFSVGTWTGDVVDQYETFNGMPVYYGSDLCDSEDSDWDDPYTLVSAAYVKDYNFDVPKGIDLMVHRHSRFTPLRISAQICTWLFRFNVVSSSVD